MIKMRYLGSKIKLLSAIESVINKYNIEGETFADLFSGTGCVGDYFKGKYKIISNDFLYYSYVLNRAKLSFPCVPQFEKFSLTYGCNIFEWLNDRNYVPNDSFFIYNNYTPHGGRMFFTDENGIKIDGIRQDIENFKADDLLNDDEYFFLLASLLESVTRYSNTSGTYEAFFKFWDTRAEKTFQIEPIEMNVVDDIHKSIVYTEDTNQLVRTIEGDIAYIDTPYTVTQYVSAYHLLETLARYDYPRITGVGGKRGRGNKNSLYARRSEAKSQFEDLLRQINFKHVIISYSNQGLVPIEELIELARLFAVDHIVHVENFDYREYQNHRSSNKSNGKKLNEIIIYFEKDLSINKSPLNYSGSKDTMLPTIIKELPYHIDTFVDVMGGAFNVGANIVTTNVVQYNEINRQIFDIVSWLLNENKKSVITDVENCINQYALEKGLRENYDVLKQDYNDAENHIKLFVLHMYSFQNMIRFNGNQKFNTPVGVAGYSDDMRNRINNFRIKSSNLIMTNLDYVNIDWTQYPKDTLFYFDPPYYITNAAYNDGKRGGKGWGIQEEVELLQILTRIHELGYKFLLSNVINHNGKSHDILIKWAEEHQFKIIDAGISGWRYSKNEVLIKNY